MTPLPRRFGMTDHDEMTGTSSWEPAPAFTGPELDHVADRLHAGVSVLARAAQEFVQGMAAALGPFARALAAAHAAAHQWPAVTPVRDEVDDPDWRSAIAARQTRNTGPSSSSHLRRPR